MSDLTRDAILIFLVVAFVINIYLNIWPSSRKRVYDENGFLRDINDQLVKDNINERDLRVQEGENFKNYKAETQDELRRLRAIVEFLGKKLDVDVSKIKV